jgi:hypothetical protein
MRKDDEEGRRGRTTHGPQKRLSSVRFQLHTSDTTHIDQVTTQLGLVPRQCSITFRLPHTVDSHALSKQPIYCIIKPFHALHKPKSNKQDPLSSSLPLDLGALSPP